MYAIHLERLKSEALAQIDAVREIVNAAEARGRSELSADEAAAVEHHRKRAEELKAEITKMKERRADQDALRDQVKALSDGVGLDAPNAYSYGSRGAKAGAPWAAAVVRQCSDGIGRYNGILPSGAVIVAVPAPPAIEMGRPASVLRSLIPSEPTAGVYQYLRQTARTNNAAVVAAGALKPTSDFPLVRVEGSVKTLAHITSGINRNDLSDAAMLGAFVESELVHGLERALESEILSGDATGEHMDGLLHVTGTTPVSFVTAGLTDGADAILTARRALTTLELLGIQADGFVMHPIDWERCETASTTTGGLLLADAGSQVPVNVAARRLYGLPVVVSVAMPQGTAIAADFAGSVRLFVREEARIDWNEGTYDPDALGEGVGASDFSRNIVRFRCEGRFGLGVLRPAGIAKIAIA
jgi:HK97 family phage major capsid protein